MSKTWFAIFLLEAPSQTVRFRRVSDLARVSRCLHRATLRCQAPCLRPVPAEEGPCLGLASYPADLAAFQSPHPLKVSTAAALPSSGSTRLRGNPGHE